MTTVRIQPSIVQGRVRPPGSKSYTHRALVASHLAGRRSTVLGPLDADDTRATARGLEALGSRIRFSGAQWTVEPSSRRSVEPARIDCGESGTTLRFLAAVAARGDRAVRFDGAGRLARRPMAELVRALVALGASVRSPAGVDRSLPLTILGPIRGGRVRLRASRSSQFASALLLVLPTVHDGSVVELVGPIVSEPYIDATLRVLAHHRIRTRRRGRRVTIPGDQTFSGASLRIPGDASSAAYFWAAAGITGGRVRVEGVPMHWPQADLAILDVLRDAGCEVRKGVAGATVRGRADRAFDCDLTDAPDLYPLAAVLAAGIPERSRVRGAPHVIHKESDRRAGAARLARALGANVRPRASGLEIRGHDRTRAFRLGDLDDHRLVMSAAVGALGADAPSVVGDARAVAKSFPEFFAALSAVSEARPS
jgi:3-phosphoshikimate 1-carboxyvinyltransferase